MMPRFLPPLAIILLSANFVAAVEPGELKPGLIAAYSDGDKGLVHRLEPTVAIRLEAGQAPHPKLSRAGRIEWKGQINVVRPGKYAFAATVQNGTLQVQVNGATVLTATGGQNPQTQLSKEVALAGGVQPFSAMFTSAAAKQPIRVELRWQGPGFRNEPLPHQVLGYLPKDRPAAFTRDVQLERGRFTFEELACIRCHKPAAASAMAKGLAERTGPNLTDVAKRSFAGWIDAWLADPARLRPHTTMPGLFSTDDRGKDERYAVVKYLVSLSGRALASGRSPTFSNEYRASMDRGRVLFTVAGCAACHTETKVKAADEDDKEPLKPEDSFFSAGTAGPTAKYALGALGSKYRPDTLAAYLQNPLKTNPAGRMPHLPLNGNEATDLARYLCRMTDDTLDTELPGGASRDPLALAQIVMKDAAPAEKKAFLKLAAGQQWTDLGKKLVVSKGCVNCHAVEAGGKPIPADAKFPSLEAVRQAGSKGCLAEKPTGSAPRYRLAAGDSAAFAAFLHDGLDGPGTPSPTFEARLALRRFNCLNCHSRDGEGGIGAGLANEMRQLSKAENADDVLPPLLTGIGHKARTPWLKSVLLQGGRARPWMQLRMPQYGEANLKALPEALAALEGIAADDTIYKAPLTASNIANGKTIVGKGGLGCISCHDIAGIPNSGTRGPDLATINQRVRYDWYERWLHQPMRMAPGTRMPQAFVDNKSTLTTVLGGDPTAQAEAMWSYLSLGTGLPLPDGLEPPKGLIIAVKERPEVLRTFMSEAGSKAIAVGYPGGVSVAFSADQCRLAYSWAGNFLDASPVWNNRGGAPAKLLGPKFWNGPVGHPWGLTVNPYLPPDFQARANNPVFGTPFPLEPARTYNGPRAVEFLGYSLDKAGRPTFRYKLQENDKGAVLKAAETPEPLKSGVAAGIARRFAIEAPGGYVAWLLAGTSNRDVRAIRPNGGGQVVPVRESPETSLGVEGVRVVLPADGEKANVLEAIGAPPGTQWKFEPKPGGGWRVILRLPESKTPLKANFTLNVWGLPKDNDELLKGLNAK